MITVHNKNSTIFDSLGLGTLCPQSCIVTEELNGLFELEMIHPYDDVGKWKRLENGNIIVSSTPKGNQAFRIYRIQPTINNISVYARHIFYDLLDNYIANCNITTHSTAQHILNSMVSCFNFTMPFQFSTTITDTNSFSIKQCNPVTALLGDGNENDSFVLKFGGELVRDNYIVNIVPSTGRDRGVSVCYSKNLTGLKIDEDYSKIVTRIFPFGKDGLEGTPVDSKYISYYPYPKVAKIENTDCETLSQLAAYAQGLFNTGIDLPTINIQVDFQLLSKTAEYKDYAILENIQLGDIVTVKNNKMGFHKKAKVISYKWNALLDKYENVQLGDFVETLANSITSGEKSLNTAMSASTEAKQIYNLISSRATINSDGLYICVDGNNIDNAKKVFQFGKEGLRYSNTGISGVWKTIINSDGVIVP